MEVYTHYICNIYITYISYHKQYFNILKFHDLVAHNELSFMHKYVKNRLPSSFKDKFVKLASYEQFLTFSNGSCQKVVHE